ncbi:MAG TPA: multicopper oxidase family protein [Actinomycetales bacterium]|nr:multicopper oxidase family protein [Actinomycetales bacterium]
MSARPGLVRRHSVLLIVLAAAALVGPLAWFWASSLVPSTYSVMDVGDADSGGGQADPAYLGGQGGHAAEAASGLTSLATLAGPVRGTPDVQVTLVARSERFRLASGEQVDGYTLNHTSPGPTITVRQGQLLQVTLVNESVADGVTLHWHGVDVPNAEDGVAGVTQDAVRVGHSHVYRFVVPDVGTYWYHSYQLAHRQVPQGLFGALVALPRIGTANPSATAGPAVDQMALVHTYEGLRTINGRVGESRVDAPAGSTVRVRFINTDESQLRVTTVGAPFRLAATDGHAVSRPGLVRDRVVSVGAGGRADLLVVTPSDGSAVRLAVGSGTTSLVVGPPGAAAPAAAPPGQPQLDLLRYGEPERLPFDPQLADRRFTFSIGRRLGLHDGRPGLWWTVNGRIHPSTPMFVVSQGDVVRLTVSNHSGQAHSLHLHGHHAVVLSRDGEQVAGSPWWVDTLVVEDGATYDLAFVADNPGIWAVHCDDVRHAAQGLVAHLVYTGVGEPFRIGGPVGNQPN